jgi:hypothetical protein
MGFIYGKNSDIDRKSGKQSKSEKKNVSQGNHRSSYCSSALSFWRHAKKEPLCF